MEWWEEWRPYNPWPWPTWLPTWYPDPFPYPKYPLDPDDEEQT